MYTHMHVYRRYLRKIPLHVPQTPIINRASRSHATKVFKQFQNVGQTKLPSIIRNNSLLLTPLWGRPIACLGLV